MQIKGVQLSLASNIYKQPGRFFHIASMTALFMLRLFLYITLY